MNFKKPQQEIIWPHKSPIPIFDLVNSKLIFFEIITRTYQMKKKTKDLFMTGFNILTS